MKQIQFLKEISAPAAAIAGNLSVAGDLVVGGQSFITDSEHKIIKGAITVVNGENTADSFTLLGQVILTGETVTDGFAEGYGILYDPMTEAIRLGCGIYTNGETPSFTFNDGEGQPIAVRDLEDAATGDLVAWDAERYCLVKARKANIGDSAKVLSDTGLAAGNLVLANTDYSTALGTGYEKNGNQYLTMAGQRGFKILNSYYDDSANVYKLELDSIEGIAEGDKFFYSALKMVGGQYKAWRPGSIERTVVGIDTGAENIIIIDQALLFSLSTDKMSFIDGQVALNGTVLPGLPDEGTQFDASGGYVEYTNRLACKIYFRNKPEFGTDTVSTGALATGRGAKALGDASVAEGRDTLAFGDYSHTEGRGTETYSEHSHAEGWQTFVSCNSSYEGGGHAEGIKTTSRGYGAHAEGHSFGRAFDQLGGYEAVRTLNDDDIFTTWETYKFSMASGHGAHSEGYTTLALGEGAHAEGNLTRAKAKAAHAEGDQTKATGHAAHSEGAVATASGYVAHAEGYGTQASAKAAHAEGAGGNIFRKEGTQYAYSSATAEAAHAEGVGTLAAEYAAHAEGRGAWAKGTAAHAEGGETLATGQCSHAEGFATEATANFAHSGGALSIAKGASSFAHGHDVIAAGDNQVVFGKYNVENTTSAFIIGLGANSNARANIFEITNKGNILMNPDAEITFSSSTKDYSNEYRHGRFYYSYHPDNTYYPDDHFIITTFNGSLELGGCGAGGAKIYNSYGNTSIEFQSKTLTIDGGRAQGNSIQFLVEDTKTTIEADGIHFADSTAGLAFDGTVVELRGRLGNRISIAPSQDIYINTGAGVHIDGGYVIDLNIGASDACGIRVNNNLVINPQGQLVGELVVGKHVITEELMDKIVNFLSTIEVEPVEE